MTHDDWLFIEGFISGAVIAAQFVDLWIRKNYVMYRRNRRSQGKSGEPK